MTAPVITRCLEADSTVHSTDRFWPIAACYKAQLSAQDPNRDQHNDFW